jgi:hypothetical protein
MISKARVFIILLAAGTALLYFNKNFLSGQLGNLSGFSNTFFGNLTSEFSLQRSRPLSTLEKEEQLKQFLPDLFGAFSESDWDGFWKLFYGKFPEKSSKNKFLPKKYRHLTPGEIERKLIDYYPDSFGRFAAAHWDYFWNGIIKLKE